MEFAKDEIHLGRELICSISQTKALLEYLLVDFSWRMTKSLVGNLYLAPSKSHEITLLTPHFTKPFLGGSVFKVKLHSVVPISQGKSNIIRFQVIQPKYFEKSVKL